MFAVGLDRLAVEQRQEDVEVFLHVPRGTVEGVAEHVLDHDLVREADAHHEPRPARGGLDGQRLLRHRMGMPRVGRHDGRHQLNRLGLGACERERAHRVVGEDVGHAKRREARCFRPLRLLNDVMDARRSACTADEDADLHVPPPITE